MITFAFFAFAGLTMASALGVLLTRQLMYAAFFLLLTFLGLAGLYVLAGADFLAVTQVMIYVGGVLVLLIFGIMLTQPTDRAASSQDSSGNRFPWLGLLTVSALFGLLVTMIIRANRALIGQNLSRVGVQPGSARSTVPIIGTQLMTEFVLPFEVAAFLLLVALVAAAYLASRKP